MNPAPPSMHALYNEKANKSNNTRPLIEKQIVLYKIWLKQPKI